jgi:hypothetical protein
MVLPYTEAIKYVLQKQRRVSFNLGEKITNSGVAKTKALRFFYFLQGNKPRTFQFFVYFHFFAVPSRLFSI